MPKYKVEIVFEADRELTQDERDLLTLMMRCQLDSLADGDVARGIGYTVQQATCEEDT